MVGVTKPGPVTAAVTFWDPVATSDLGVHSEAPAHHGVLTGIGDPEVALLADGHVPARDQAAVRLAVDDELERAVRSEPLDRLRAHVEDDEVAGAVVLGADRGDEVRVARLRLQHQRLLTRRIEAVECPPTSRARRR
jgi:hypothetical protein